MSVDNTDSRELSARQDRAGTPNFDNELTSYKTALSRYTTGVSIIATRTVEGKKEGLTANSFVSISLRPRIVMWCLQNDAASLGSFINARFFSVNILSANQIKVAQHFAKRSFDKFAAIAHYDGKHGCPILLDGSAHFECEVHQIINVGDHHVIFGSVLDYGQCQEDPLIYSCGSFLPVP
jgi:flavin reductase (DIM6/NTAB) family NADH-FMN oxidoreductase RutF